MLLKESGSVRNLNAETQAFNLPGASAFWFISELKSVGKTVEKGLFVNSRQHFVAHRRYFGIVETDDLAVFVN